MSGPVTLGFLLDHRQGLRATCQACAHTASLPVDELAAKHGRDATVPQIKAALRCIACDAERAIVSIDGWPQTQKEPAPPSTGTGGPEESEAG